MCGNFGIATKSFLTVNERDLFKELMVANHIRGTDATGVIRLAKKSVVSHIKSDYPSPFFAFSEQGDDFIEAKDLKGNLPDISILMGHARSATVGALEEKNAHPFCFPTVVGMHNGTIVGDFIGSKEYDTDSEATYSLIDKLGVEAALKKINAEATDTAYALQMISTQDKKMVFIRNDRRPLWFCWIAGGTSLVWSSDKETLIYCVTKSQGNTVWNGEHLVKEEFFTTDFKGKVFQPKEDVLFSFCTKDLDVKEFEVKKLDIEKKYNWHSWGNSYQTGYNYSSAEQRRKRTAAENKKTSAQKTIDAVLAYRNGIHKAPENKNSIVYQNYKEQYSTSIHKLPWLTTEDADEKKKPNFVLIPDVPPRKKPISFTESIQDLIDHDLHDLNEHEVFIGYNGQEYTELQMLRKLEEGCKSCGVELEYQETLWIGKHDGVCSSCVNLYPDLAYMHTH